MHHINIMPYKKVLPIKKIKENWPLFPWSLLTTIGIWFTKTDLNIFHLFIHLVTKLKVLKPFFPLVTYWKPFFACDNGEIKEEIFGDQDNHFLSILKLTTRHIMLTKGVCFMSFHTASRQVFIFREVIYNLRARHVTRKTLDDWCQIL